MSNPIFTAQVVLHYMVGEGFEMVQSIHSLNTPLYDGSDDLEFIVDAARALVEESAIYKTLTDGDYVTVALAGELNFVKHTDWEGITEYDMRVEPAWHNIRILLATERAAVDESEGIL